MSQQARWYVYELIDPRDGFAFYVGKGCGNRIHAHEREAERGRVCSEKINKIKDIWSAGLTVERRHVAFFWDEQDAYDFEAARVAEYSLEALTNIVPGGGSPRAAGNFIQRVKPMTAVEIAEALARKENLLSWFALWLRTKARNEALKFTGGNRWTVALLEVSMRTIFPGAWEKIEQDRAALEIVRPGLLRHGVEIQYGCA